MNKDGKWKTYLNDFLSARASCIKAEPQKFANPHELTQLTDYTWQPCGGIIDACLPIVPQSISIEKIFTIAALQLPILWTEVFFASYIKNGFFR
jgi:hypothetical protein